MAKCSRKKKGDNGEVVVLTSLESYLRSLHLVKEGHNVKQQRFSSIRDINYLL